MISALFCLVGNSHCESRPAKLHNEAWELLSLRNRCAARPRTGSPGTGSPEGPVPLPVSSGLPGSQRDQAFSSASHHAEGETSWIWGHGTRFRSGWWRVGDRLESGRGAHTGPRRCHVVCGICDNSFTGTRGTWLSQATIETQGLEKSSVMR